MWRQRAGDRGDYHRGLYRFDREADVVHLMDGRPEVEVRTDRPKGEQHGAEPPDAEARLGGDERTRHAQEIESEEDLAPGFDDRSCRQPGQADDMPADEMDGHGGG